MEQNRREWNGGIKQIAQRATKSPSRIQYPSVDDMKDTHSEQIKTVCYCNNDNGVAGNGFLGITLRLKLNYTICAFLLLARLICTELP